MNNGCNGYFLDYFEKVKNIEFINNIDFNIDFKNRISDIISYKGSYRHPLFKPDYTKLKLRPYMEKIIKKRISILKNNYISIHVRRTDHLENDKEKRTTENEFRDFIDKYKNTKNLYIATDNQETFNNFYSRYSELIKFNFMQRDRELFTQRSTPLKDAIIDLYMCIYSDNFKGSYYSSFSDLIRNLRINDLHENKNK
jgi:hypothetical protein